MKIAGKTSRSGPVISYSTKVSSESLSICELGRVPYCKNRKISLSSLTSRYQSCFRLSHFVTYKSPSEDRTPRHNRSRWRGSYTSSQAGDCPQKDFPGLAMAE
ncbi:hypothetical protein VTN00DRAFT_4134 [Thermoascus crustaceus]|uniref:uncharacterized protein n=1 Tax=Thermoascus crustaceus TaxID=5088 RepID=UPI0037431476